MSSVAWSVFTEFVKIEGTGEKTLGKEWPTWQFGFW